MGMSRITLPFPLFLAGGVALFAAGINVCLLALAFTGAHPGTSARAARVRAACAQHAQAYATCILTATGLRVGRAADVQGADRSGHLCHERAARRVC